MKIEQELFRTGVPLIDKQHDEYIRLVSRLYKLCGSSHVEWEMVDATLAEAFNYAVEHFDAEEGIMLAIGYPHYAVHRAKHDEFRDEIDRLSALSKQATTPDHLLVQLTEWLLEWFMDQTQTHDRRLANYLRKVICNSSED